MAYGKKKGGKKKGIVSLLFAAAFLGLPAQAQQPRCGPTEALKRVLEDQFGEVSIWSGIVERDGVLGVTEIYANSDTGTWTIVTSSANGRSCVGLYGEGSTLLNITPGDPA